MSRKLVSLFLSLLMLFSMAPVMAEDSPITVTDMFGREITLIRKENGYCSTTVEVCVSRQFLGWVFSLGEGVRITAPQALVRQMRSEAERLLEAYRGEE